jgi:LCP family protein required for cell wall assembly
VRTPGGRRLSLTWLILGLFVTALLVGVAVYRPFAVKAGTTGTAGVAEADPAPPPAKLPGQRVTFLMMGVDKRQDDPGRADSMVVVSYDPASQQMALLSLARDTWAQIPGHGYDKINHAYAFGGERLAMQTVERLLGIPIDHYVTFNFMGFAKIVDALGGVDIDAEKRMLYHDPSDDAMGPDGLVIDIQPGMQHMAGLDALKYARFRADDEGDLGRMRRQQQVAKALMKTAATPSVITHIPQLIPAVAGALETDLSVAEMLKLATSARDALSHPLNTGALSGEDKIIGGIFYFIPDLVKERATAYQLLVGSVPPSEFESRAREDQDVYTRALAEATAESSPPPTVSDGAPPIVGTQPGNQGQQPPAGKPPVTTNPQTPKPPKSQPLTVAVIDASGHGLATAYVNKLKAAGFRVARVGKASAPIPRTVAMDHALQPGTAEKIKAVLPNAMVVPAKDSQAGEAVEIILGADLAKSDN